jgi:hypothetical protein
MRYENVFKRGVVLMHISILSSEVNNIAKSISKYIFKESKNKNRQNIKWLNEFTKFYRLLKPSDTEYTDIEIDGVVREDLAEIISNHLYDELNEMEEENSEWLFEIMSIYNQLTENTVNSNDVNDVDNETDKTAASEIGDNYDSANAFVVRPNKKVVKNKSKDKEKEKQEKAEEIEEEEEETYINESVYREAQEYEDSEEEYELV